MTADRPTLGTLAGLVEGSVTGDPDTRIVDVTHDSRQAAPGVLFVAVRGQTVDGHRFVHQVLEAGGAVVVEDLPPPDAPAIVVDDTRRALAPLAAAVQGHPSASMNVVGVTGTNGKTTVTHLLESIFQAAGEVSGRVGTIGASIAGRPFPMERTTPEASDFQRLLRAMVDAGAAFAAVEVSSHALQLGRADNTQFAVAAFTNLSQDHLDFHGSMSSYFSAKRRLFTDFVVGRSVVALADVWGRRLAGEIGADVTVGIGEGDLRIERVELALEGSRFVVTDGERRQDLEVALAGDFNVMNAAVAFACAAELGIPWDTIAAGIAACPAVPGRFERVDTGGDVAIVVDYAHTPAGIQSVIASTRRIAPTAGLRVVVGAGGDRDRAKRPLMGAAAAEADTVYFTSDNPRSEDPLTIVAEVAAGALGANAVVETEPDRRAAIGRAIREADPGDVVLILGKGHEQGQQFSGHTVPFDDREVAREEARGR